jgi:ribonuclease HII
MSPHPDHIIIGLDEVGRGPLAGPVVACALVLPADPALIPPGIADSKILSPAKRARLAPLLRENCLHALGEASVAEIDELNILQATFLAMQRAVSALSVSNAYHILVDGPHVPPGLPFPATAVVDGDAKVPAIAAASIIAKVARDDLMQKLAAQHPGYGWERNAGYGTREHLEALAQHGVTPHHRTSFAPVARQLSRSTAEL